MAGASLHLQVKDNGAGYPEAVLEILQGAAKNESSPHILGLHLVRQIVEAHHGTALFFNDEGAAAEIAIPAPGIYGGSAAP